MGDVKMGTPPKKINMEPKNWWFVDVFPFPKGHFSGSMLIFVGCMSQK